MQNRWKKAFFILSGTIFILILISVILFSVLLSSSGQQKAAKENKPIPNSNPLFTISAHKDELVQFINKQVIQKNKKVSSINYKIAIQDDVRLIGDLHVFTAKIPFVMIFEPQVTQNGEVVLKEKSTQLGRLYLPEDQVLKFIKKGTALPEWVSVDPSKKEIDVELSKYIFKKMFYLKADRIDLKNDVIKFSIYQK